MDESASVKELPRQEDVDDVDGEIEERDDRYGNIDDMDRDIDEENPDAADGMYSGRKDKNFLSLEE